MAKREERPKEEDCPRCNGTGKVTVCPLCRNTGFVSENINDTWVAVRCPNGCDEPKVTLDG